MQTLLTLSNSPLKGENNNIKDTPLPLGEGRGGSFPILDKVLYGKYPLVYLDNAATTQKPRQVVEAMTEEY